MNNGSYVFLREKDNVISNTDVIVKRIEEAEYNSNYKEYYENLLMKLRYSDYINKEIIIKALESKLEEYEEITNGKIKQKEYSLKLVLMAIFILIFSSFTMLYLCLIR